MVANVATTMHYMTQPIITVSTKPTIDMNQCEVIENENMSSP